ncbi:signal peptidase I [Erwinia sp. CPCC 100877]|nr:signal peptidase I [Erwinia sp. CPCC 100877]
MLSVLTGSVMIAVMQKQDKSLAGYRIFGVLTNSMVSPGDKIRSGGFRAGDLLIIKETPEDEIKVGDVITYHPSSDPINKSTNYLTHRVVAVKEEFGNEKGIYFVTRGDANQTDDMPISADSLVGKVTWKVPKIAGVLNFIRENLLISVIFIVSVLGFVWIMQNYILTSKTTTEKKRKKKRKRRKKQKK